VLPWMCHCFGLGARVVADGWRMGGGWVVDGVAGGWLVGGWCGGGFGVG
jgi:hypothetical protein